MIKCILWDFNGTLLNDVDCSIKSMNTLLEKRGLSKIKSVDQYRSIFTFPVYDYYVKLGYDFSKESFEDISIEFIANYDLNFKDCKLNDKMNEILTLMKEHQISNNILSASKQDALIDQVAYLGVEDQFDQILGISDIYARSKVDLAQKWFENSSYKANEILFIGDTNHDAEVAKAIGCNCILLSYGHQSKEVLSTTNCKIINTADELWNYFTALLES